MTDQHKAGETTRKGAAHGQRSIDRERVILALIGLAGAAFIVAMNFR